jgi:ATP-dependent RNA helicase RhlE
MALHGNKSQSARTQALGGFKSGDIRALVATDIAARGIDIDDLPHVVNYDIPNVTEDYVHRIGRTGRAGADGAAVNLVCLDEEGFMQAIERFTKQEIAVRIIDGFMPEPGEIAEPIAMGRQTIWGGAGRAPSRDVMMAAGRAARTEMLQRVRDNRAGSGAPGQGSPRGRSASGSAGGGGNSAGNGGGNGRPAGGGGRNGAGNGGSGRSAPHGAGRNTNGFSNGNAPRDAGRPPHRDTHRDTNRDGNRSASRDPNHDDFQPASSAPRNFSSRTAQDHNAPVYTDPGNLGAGNRHEPRAPQGQPDPMRTSVDVMSRGNGRNGGGARRTGGGGGGYGGNRSGGGGGGYGGGRSGGGRG